MNKRLVLRTKIGRVINLKFVKDLPDGNLFIAEALREIPFDIKRIYFINNLANPKAVRGKHAHRKLEQVIFCINGSFVLHLDDGTTKQKITLNDPSKGILLAPMLWHTMASYSYDCVMLVLASAAYDESDYIRQYDEFLEIADALKSK